MVAAPDPRGGLAAHAPTQAPGEQALAGDYARSLLSSLGIAVSEDLAPAAEHPAIAAARGGLTVLSGCADGPARLCPLPLASCADGALAALAALAGSRRAAFDDLRGSDLLGLRAAFNGLGRNGAIAPGGSCHLLPTADGAIALNLARDDDWDLLPAWLETAVAPDWHAVAAVVAGRTMHDCVERGRELGMAVAPRVPVPSRPPPWVRGIEVWHEAAPPLSAARRPRVVDLSSLWAGPLCSHLLQRAGAEVIKVESTHRPDGARSGPAAFFDWLNAGKRSVALDLRSDPGRRALRALVASADIVIEASRPRALRQLGIDAEALVRARPGLTWISISGYGRAEPQAQWVAFGDDAGVGAGLSELMQRLYGETLFVGDAIADPLTGVHAALAAWAGWCRGGGGLLALALCDVVRHCAGFDRPADAGALHARLQRWQARVERAGLQPQLPAPPRVAEAAAALGADTDAVLATPAHAAC
ncbi:MAG: CoA transferase [Nevskiales bacterium]|nr:CoA transferase [Nevskiales bacterium]